MQKCYILLFAAFFLLQIITLIIRHHRLHVYLMTLVAPAHNIKKNETKLQQITLLFFPFS